MYSIGIDLGGTNIAVGLCDSHLNIIDKISAPTGAGRAPSLIVKDMAELSKKLVDRNRLHMSDIGSVGIAAPGTVDPDRGVIEYSNNIRMKDFAIIDEFRKHFDIDKISLANDANAAALGEAIAGCGRGAKGLVMITLGTGVGGGIIIDGKIFTGTVNAAGAELGHTVIVSRGRQCTCGRRGCFEAYSSATALVKATEDKIKELKLLGIESELICESEKEGRISGRTAFNAAKRGDKYAKEITDEYIYYLADGITNVINIFQPEIVAIGGGVSGEGENLLKPLCELVDRAQYTRDGEKKTKIVIATLGNDAGIIGAAAL